MLDPTKNRLEVAGMLKPPLGYELAEAIACTYSLDLEALLAALLPLGLQADIVPECLDNPLFMLHAINQALPKLTILCDANALKIPPPNTNKLIPLLDQVIRPIALPQGAFHPKCWIIKFIRKNKPDDAAFRLIVSSRNLTFDRSWDMAIQMEGTQTQEVNPDSKALADFLEDIIREDYLRGKKMKARTAKRMQGLLDVLKEIPTVNFHLDATVPKDFKIMPLGNKNYCGHQNTPLWKGKGKHLMVISPFLTQQTLDTLFEHAGEDCEKLLLTRQQALDAITCAKHPNLRTFCLNPYIVDGEQSLEDTQENPTRQLQDIHAKFYALQQYEGSRPLLYLGSMNATHNATGNWTAQGIPNRELLIQFKPATQNIFETIRKELLEAQGGQPIFQPATPNFPQASTEDDIQKELQSTLKLILAKTVFQAKASQQESTWTITLTARNLPRKFEGCSLTLAPLYGEHMPLTPTMSFSPLSTQQLSNFYRIHISKQEQHLERLLVIDTLSEKDATRRDDCLQKGLLDSAVNLIEYIGYLLDENPYLKALRHLNAPAENAIAASQAQCLGDGLYEQMLFWAAQDPSRLKQLMDVLDNAQLPEAEQESLARLKELCRTICTTRGL